MEVDDGFFFNFVPILALVLAIKIASIIVIQRLKLRWPITVNCWFCNENKTIERSEKSWWKCSSCEQHNGFSKEGDYNYEIPEQRKQSLNKSKWKVYLSSIESKSNFNNKNGLCLKCNKNEEFKMHEMRSIDPSHWRQSEIENFKQSLEEKYPLCQSCDTYVRKVLRKQAAWLTQYKMLFFKQRPITFIIKNCGKLEKICRRLLTIISTIIIYNHTLQPLPILGALLQLFVVAKKINSKGTSDAILTLLWLAIFGLVPFQNQKLITLNLNHWILKIEYLTGYHIIMVLSATLGFINALTKTIPVPKLNVFFKKLEISKNDSMESTLNASSQLKDYINENKPQKEEHIKRPSPVNITHLLTSQSSLTVPTPLKPSATLSNFSTPYHQQRTSLTSMPSTQFRHQTAEFETCSKQTLSDSLRNLSSLSLSGSDRKQSNTSPKMFETKTYATSNPDLFKINAKNQFIGKKFILAPSKLKSVTHSSWVAGGYWQMGMDLPTLSRSSSQSSGFGSAGSNFEPSREPSVVNDVDRCSVTSDATVCCHSIQNQSPTNSVCSHTSSYRVPSPTNSMLNISPCFQQPQRTFCHNYHQNEYLLNQSMICKPIRSIPEVPVCTYPTTTVSTNPSWLPALVCGSIVLNVIVFCTVLIRS